MRASLAALLLTAALAAPALAADAQTFGAPLKGLEPARLADVMASPVDGQALRLEGTIKKVCQNKGCWLELAQGEQSIHMTFKDYGFFVPKDSAGKAVAAEGIVKVKKPSAEQQKHMEEEGATRAAAGVTFEAAGVEIR